MVPPRFCRSKYALLLGVTVVASVWLIVPSLRQDTVLVPARSDDAPSRALAADDDILISLFPPDTPALTEGFSFQLICTATGAEQVFFELPKLSTELLSSVNTIQQHGRAVLSFKSLELAHQATYTCHAVSVKKGIQKTRRFELVVFPDESKEEEVKDKEERMRVREGEELAEWEARNMWQKVEEEEEGGEKEGEEGEREGGEGFLEEEKQPDAGNPADSKFSVPVFETMEDRAKYQREKVDEFCTRFGLDDVKYQLPTAPPRSFGRQNEVYSYNRHLLLDQKHKILFCFVPKVGCTNLKLVVFVSQGIIRRSELSKARDDVDQKALEGAMFRNSFISIKDDRRKQQALESYYKYTMFRNPLERLASGYRSKVERFPLSGLKLDSPHFNWLRMDIYKATHPSEFKLWKLNRGKAEINITFPDFVDYWANNAVLNKVDGYLDEHFLMISEMCQPCRTRFDFYGNFRHFDRDAQVLIDKIGASSSDLRQGYYSDDTSSTDQRMRLYYSTLSQSQKTDVLRKMALELEFHYTIFPEERDSHKQILDIDIDLPL